MSQLCQHGDCTSYDTAKDVGIGITGAGWRARFCSWEHAALWILNKVSAYSSDADIRLAAIEAKNRLEPVVDRFVKGAKI